MQEQWEGQKVLGHHFQLRAGENKASTRLWKEIMLLQATSKEASAHMRSHALV